MGRHTDSIYVNSVYFATNKNKGKKGCSLHVHFALRVYSTAENSQPHQKPTVGAKDDESFLVCDTILPEGG